MKKQVLFIQGAGDGAYQADEKLAKSLRDVLGASYEVRYPEMQNEGDPDYETWARQIEGELATLNDTVALVGHSLGASILIKYLSETRTKKTVTGIFLIAAPFWGGDNGWTYDGYETLVLPTVTQSRLPKDIPLFIYHSNDDETVPFSHLALYAKRFPVATIHKFKGRGHQLGNDLSEVARDIKGVTV